MAVQQWWRRRSNGGGQNEAIVEYVTIDLYRTLFLSNKLISYVALHRPHTDRFPDDVQKKLSTAEQES
jgi:hypothetical protein